MLDNQLNSRRQFIVGAIFILVVLTYIIRLLFVQVIDDKYILSAESNSQRHITQYPTRGLIFDRNGKLMVFNQATYDLMIIPKQTESFDTLLFSKLLDIPVQSIRKKIKKAKRYSRYKPSIFQKQISDEMYASFQEYLHLFPGFFVNSRTLRDYTEPVGAHFLGYVGEVSDKIIKKDDYYKGGDYVGISGIEKQYEKILRGKKGNKIQLVDVHNRVKGKYKKGKYDVPAVRGKNITTTIDLPLQVYGEHLMQYKKGSIVALEPKTGEILALVTAPSYDPSILVGRPRSKNYRKLQRDTLKPLFDRALTAQYPPGSIFKIVNGLIALDGDFIGVNTYFACDKYLVNCHNHPENTSVLKAIQFSCNPYFHQAYRRIIQQGTSENRFIDSRFGLNYWREHVLSFGMGRRLETDLPQVKSGNIPSIDFYDRWYGENRWAFSNIASNAIGQGEVMVVPIQMVNLAAIIANSGYYKTPHILKAVEGETQKYFQEKHQTLIDSVWFKPMQEAMYAVVNENFGTARRAQIDSIAVCGKTGTVQNPHGKDHSVFIAYAPKDKPQIAIAVYVENSGFGGTWAAPIASLMIEKYLNGTISDKHKKYKERRILEYTPLKVEREN